jgi:hypothetical protein
MKPAVDRTHARVKNPPSTIAGLRRRSLQAAATGSADPSLAFDGEPYTHWIVDFDASSSRANKPTLNLAFDDPVTITHYSIMSGNAHPQQDPSSWVVYCRKPDDMEGDWELIDTKTDELWDSRHETRTFQMTPVGNIYPSCAEIGIVITDLRDATYQGGAGIGLNGEVTELSLDSFTPKMQLAEVELYNDESVMNPDFVSTTTVIEDDGISLLFFLVVICVFSCVIIGFLYVLQREKAQKDHAVALLSAADLGFDLESMTVDDVLALKERETTSDIEEAFAQVRTCTHWSS